MNHYYLLFSIEKHYLTLFIRDTLQVNMQNFVAFAYQKQCFFISVELKYLRNLVNLRFFTYLHFNILLFSFSSILFELGGYTLLLLPSKNP